MDVSIAFLIVCWLMVFGGVALVSIPAALIVGGALIGLAGVFLLPSELVRRPRAGERP